MRACCDLQHDFLCCYLFVTWRVLRNAMSFCVHLRNVSLISMQHLLCSVLDFASHAATALNSVFSFRAQVLEIDASSLADAKEKDHLLSCEAGITVRQVRS